MNKRPFLHGLVRFCALAGVTLLVMADGAVGQAPSPAAPPFVDGDRVVFVGDSITRGGGFHSVIQLFYATRFPDRTIVAFNAGHSGGASGDTLRRLQWDILDHKPTLAVVMFGMNDMGGKIGDSSMPIADAEKKIAEKIARVQVNYEKLLDALAAANVRLILVGPSIYEETANLPAPAEPFRNLGLTRWTERVREIAARRNAGFVDLGAIMNPIDRKLQAADPGATIIGGDRVHPGPAGHLVMGYAILKAQGMTPRVSDITVDAITGKAGDLHNCTVDTIEKKEGGIAFTCTEKALPFVSHPTMAAGFNLVPFEQELNREMLTVANLWPGRYDLRIDDVSVGFYSAVELAAGINLASNTRTPQYKQASEVMQANEIRHAQESGNIRLKAFLRHALLEPAGVDPNDPVAVEKCLREAIEKRPVGDFSRTMSEHYLKNVVSKWDVHMKTYTDAIAKIAQARIPKPHRFSLVPLAEADVPR